MRSSWVDELEFAEAKPGSPRSGSDGAARTAPPEAPTRYHGELGVTRSRAVRVRNGDALVSVEVYVAVNADTDAELGRRARGELAAPLHALRVAGEAIELAIPLRYHEPSLALFALVLPPALCHCELEERAELLRLLHLEPAGTPLPDYLLRCPVVIGAPGLAALRRGMIGARVALGSTPPPLDAAVAAPSRQPAPAPDERGVLGEDAAPPEVVDWHGGEKTETSGRMVARSDTHREVHSQRAEPTSPDTLDEDLSAGVTATGESTASVGGVALPLGADPLTTETREEPLAPPDSWLSMWMSAGASGITLQHGRVRVALPASVVHDAEGLRGALDARLVLHRTAGYPVVVLLIGAPMALRIGRNEQLAAICLDAAIDRDRAVLGQLARRFELLLEVFAAGRVLRRVTLAAPLADNAAYVARAAADYRQYLRDSGQPLLMERARDQVLDREFDLTGAHHRHVEDFRDYQLVQVRTAEQLRGALAIVETFSQPDGEDYLVCVRGFPLPRWRRLRRHVLEQAVTWGIWMGSSLAHIAVSEGLARSRRDLVQRLLSGFELLRQHPTACDLDDLALDDNRGALAREARALGVAPGRSRSLIVSEMDSVVAGTIDLVVGGAQLPVAERSVAELRDDLRDPGQRLAAALELCRRGAAECAEDIVAAACRMSRAEASQALARCAHLGPDMVLPLIAALTNSKSYIRQGAALALGHLRAEECVTAVIELLLAEPTEIWKEIARALGQVGPVALHHLTLIARERGTAARVEERVAWAMAFLGARDCRREITQMSSSQSIMAPIAAKALALVEPAIRDQQALVAEVITPEITMNRTFSRQFFGALEEHGGVVEEIGQDRGSRMVVLDDRELASKN